MIEQQDDGSDARGAGRTAALLAARGETLAVAESSTGGLIMSLLTDIPGASAWLSGGVVAYTNKVKQDLLGLSADALAAHGAVSLETARAMARGGARLFGSTWALAETGVAGPRGSRRSAKAIGVTYLTLIGTPAAGPVERTMIYEAPDPDDRVAVKRAFAAAAFGLLIDVLDGVSPMRS